MSGEERKRRVDYWRSTAESTVRGAKFDWQKLFVLSSRLYGPEGDETKVAFQLTPIRIDCPFSEADTSQGNGGSTE